MSEWIINNEAYLAHHGIKGQKWGLRRYQNEDGSLTPAGMRRYGHMTAYTGKTQATQDKMRDWWNLDDSTFRGKYRQTRKAFSRSVKRYGDPELYGRKATREAYYQHRYKKNVGAAESSNHYNSRNLRNKGAKRLALGGSIATLGALHVAGGFALGYANGSRPKHSKLMEMGAKANLALGALGIVGSLPITAVGAIQTIKGGNDMRKESDLQRRYYN